jgi:hypothetical protein
MLTTLPRATRQQPTHFLLAPCTTRGPLHDNCSRTQLSTTNIKTGALRAKQQTGAKQQQAPAVHHN